MNQKQLASLFGIRVMSINSHLNSIFQSGELDSKAASRKIKISQQEGMRQVNRKVLFYSMEVVIALGYRIHSTQAIQFRVWMTAVIKQFLEKGFLLDEGRLLQAQASGSGFLEELQSRMVEINQSIK